MSGCMWAESGVCATEVPVSWAEYIHPQTNECISCGDMESTYVVPFFQNGTEFGESKAERSTGGGTADIVCGIHGELYALYRHCENGKSLCSYFKITLWLLRYDGAEGFVSLCD